MDEFESQTHLVHDMREYCQGAIRRGAPRWAGCEGCGGLGQGVANKPTSTCVSGNALAACAPSATSSACACSIAAPSRKRPKMKMSGPSRGPNVAASVVREPELARHHQLRKSFRSEFESLPPSQLSRKATANQPLHGSVQVSDLLASTSEANDELHAGHARRVDLDGAG
jgi:hypothetical protein